LASAGAATEATTHYPHPSEELLGPESDLPTTPVAQGLVLRGAETTEANPLLLDANLLAIGLHEDKRTRDADRSTASAVDGFAGRVFLS
jgi:hypothetical protein